MTTAHRVEVEVDPRYHDAFLADLQKNGPMDKQLIQFVHAEVVEVEVADVDEANRRQLRVEQAAPVAGAAAIAEQ